MTGKPLTYKDAGVDIDAGNELVDRIKPLVSKTMRDGVLTGIGGFGGLFALGDRYADPVLVSGTDGVGTKLKLAHLLKRHDTIGIDLVAMCVNDILVQGAEPLFFLDYFACGKLDVDTAANVVAGIADGCLQAGAALIGGETAEMPDMYAEGEYDLAGFAVGAVDREKIIDGSTISSGDAVIALASSGPHSNGYSLIRRALEQADTQRIAGQVAADVLLTPTRIYVKPVLALLDELSVKGMAHITGGGLTENLPRCLPEGMQARLDMASWEQGETFDWLQRTGNIETDEMRRTFNCGVGFCLVVCPEDAGRALHTLQSRGESAWVIGAVEPGGDGVVYD